ncbi:MAG: sulfatase [Pirellulaceae bacterium]|nr:sulfatase [Pirellulaceae bacterium]
MKRSVVIFLLTVACFLNGNLLAEERPNIVFIFSDDHANHAIGAYEGLFASVNPTPNIDALAAKGMLFQNSFCTNSICGPSRAVILTGLHSHKNGFRKNGDNFDGSQLTFPKLLQKAGYRTAMIGKWHLISNPQGFDYWDILPGQGDYYNPMFISQDNQRSRVEGHCTDIVTDKAIAWLDQTKTTGKPFVLMCQHKAPHRTWMPAIRHLDLYADLELPEPDTLFDEWEDNASGAKFQQMEIDRHMHLNFDLHLPLPAEYDAKAEKGKSLDKSGFRNKKNMNATQLAQWDAKWKARNEAFYAANLEGKDLVRWKFQRYVKNYLRCVKGVDESVGRITDWLNENGMADNTVVIYASDQGFYLGDHGWYDKRWMYDESMMMPLIVSWPGVTQPGSVNDELVQNLDYAPTFLDIAGVKPPPTMQGRSLVPLLEGETPADWRESLYYHYYGYPAVHMVPRHCGVRTKNHKLMNFYQFGEWEFYDLKRDPDEIQNLYGKEPSLPQIEELKKELLRLQDLYEDKTDLQEKPAAWKQQFRGDQ